tara:strand:- start:169 stop:456 length:288 start_codon:yes stop_codon:yes gene_type:complete
MAKSITRRRIMAQPTTIEVGPINQETGKKDSIPVAEIEVPDLWQIAQDLKQTGLKVYDRDHNGYLVQRLAGDLVLDLWHLTHDLKRGIQALAEAK